MSKSKTTTSFRFDDDFIGLLNAWSLVTRTDKAALLQEAFREYIKLDRNADTAKKVNRVTGILKVRYQEGP
jgi:predicted transcriptional regulator